MSFANRILGKANGLAGVILVSLVLGVAVLGNVYTPHDPLKSDLLNRFAGSSLSHPLGTDMFGRDILSRLMRGAWVSVSIGLSTLLIPVVLGTLLGAAAGYFRGWFDRVLIVVLDALMAFPGLLIALGLMAIIGPNRYGVILALSVAYLPTVTRVVRGSVLSVSQSEFVEASTTMGNSRFYTLLVHVLPNCIAPLIVLTTMMFGWVLLAESALSFLGLGVPPPEPSWGNILAEAKAHLMRYPMLGLLPGLCISVALLGVNFLGDALRDELDPKSTTSKEVI
ncbi:ABC transporter permease [Nitratireductor aquibiodomus RA22]|uniref:ABC transporter permease n=1 Tax=Nitratireductor aquibiodomus RA22 TaxID=1189611 RepID=I5C3Z9_9HYPH|nr:ABC transporter permease [Nitratireductor aquibiodomus]EIM76551.1 ABC transporter permease [Nitratireductor aquibiodomus RA22]